MLKYFNITIIVVALFLLGCNDNLSTLKSIEPFINLKPDSALKMLQNIQPNELHSDDEKAFYGILLFQALDLTNQTLPPDSIINFSVNYYQTKNNNRELAIAYYYKARLYKKAQRFDDATTFYLKSLDIIQNSKEYNFLGKIYSDLGDICSIQKDYNAALLKYKTSLKQFQDAKNVVNASYKLIDIGRVYRFLNKGIEALKYYRKAIVNTKDSIVNGLALQEIGINYFNSKEYDSAQFYLKKSLHYPYNGTSYAIRCAFLGEVFYSINQLDSASNYANMALKYPNTFFNQRDCYRILANSEYNLRNFDKAEIYMGKYQDYSDSVRILVSQTKSTVLEDLHNSTVETRNTKHKMLFIFSVLVVTFVSAILVSLLIYKRNKLKKEQLIEIKGKLNSKQGFLVQNIQNRLDGLRISQAEARKKASSQEKELLDKELYEKAFHLNNWTEFETEMNQTFNNILITLQTKNESITRRELIWCCLQLLDIPVKDRMILLNTTKESLYKLKQRLAKKLLLTNTRDLDSFLKELIVIKN